MGHGPIGSNHQSTPARRPGLAVVAGKQEEDTMEQELGAVMDERLKEHLDAASDAMEAAIRQMTVGIVHGSGEKKWQYIAAGTLVRWRGRHFILTAEHVVRDTEPEDFRFF